MKSSLTFALACVSALVLLSACGGGGGGGVSLAPSSNPGISPNPVTQPPSPPAPGVQSLLPANAYTVVGGTTQIKTDGLFGYYSSRYDISDDVIDNNGEYLMISADSHSNRDYYRVIRNPASGVVNGLVVPPALLFYQVLSGQTVASLIEEKGGIPGSQITAGQSFTLTSGAKMLTVEIGTNNLTVVDGESIDFGGGGYDGSAHRASSRIPGYAFLLKGDFSALYLELNPSPVEINSWSFGTLADYDEVAAIGSVTYRINRVIGSYGHDADRRLLKGSGTLVADFSNRNRMVTLNLDVNDHNGDNFMDVVNLGISLDANRNEIHCGYGLSADSSPACSGGMIDYADGLGLQDVDVASSGHAANIYNVRGSFYGTDGDEIAGGMSHRNTTSGARMELGFIGWNATPIAIVPIPAPSVGEVSPLVSNAYVTNSGTTRISISVLYKHYSPTNSRGVLVTAANRRFLRIDPDATGTVSFGGASGLLSRYMEVRNSMDGSAFPYFVTYIIGTNRTSAYISRVVRPDAQFTLGQQYPITLGASTISLSSPVENELRVDGGSFITISAGYRGRAHSTSSSYDDYGFLLEAEYSALYMELRTRTTADYHQIGESSRWGSLTPYAKIPRIGRATYKIDHVVGTYTDKANQANSRLLSGNGTLRANFTTDSVTLNLNVIDHNGANFMDVTNLGMRIDANRNEFHCNGFPNTGSQECTGSIIYHGGRGESVSDLGGADDQSIYSSVGLNVQGSFYGPRAEEVAGGINHFLPAITDGAFTRTSDTETELVFIGKKQ